MNQTPQSVTAALICMALHNINWEFFLYKNSQSANIVLRTKKIAKK